MLGGGVDFGMVVEVELVEGESAGAGGADELGTSGGGIVDRADVSVPIDD